MDASTRTTLTVRIDGRELQMYTPLQGQLIALKMVQSGQLGNEAKLGIITELFLSLFTTPDDRAWFVGLLATGAVNLDAMMQAITDLANGGPKEPEAEEAAERALPQVG